MEQSEKKILENELLALEKEKARLLLKLEQLNGSASNVFYNVYDLHNKLFNTSAIPKSHFDKHGKYIRVNAAFCDFFELSEAEILGKSFLELTHPDDFEKSKFNFEEIISEKVSSIDIEKKYILKSGKTKWGHVFVEPFYNSKKQLVFFISQILDITEKKESGIIIANSRNTFSTILDNMENLLIICDAETKLIKYANENSKKVFGSVLNKKCYEFLSNNNNTFCDACKHKKNHENVNFPRIWEDFFQTNNKWYSLSERMIKWIDGSDCYLIIANDISEHKKLLSQISDSEKRFKVLSDSSFEAIFLSENGYYIDVNKVASELFGYSYEELIGKFGPDIFSEDCREQVKINTLSGYEKPYEAVAIRKNNEEFYVEIRGKTFDYMGKQVRVAAVRDITERKNAEKTLQENEQKLRDLNATKDKFFSIIAHDLKNPFNQLIGFTDLLLMNIRDYTITEIEEFIQLLNKSAKNGYRLLENLLEWSRTQTDKKQFNPEEFYLKELILKNIELLHNNAKTKNINIELDIEFGIMVYADYNMILTVLRNLISNSIKFTKDSGEIKIKTRKIEDEVEISISDNGVGISEEDQQKLFRIDVHHSTKGTNNEAGTGLGLILCKEFIAMNSGKIWVESSEDCGSTFYFTLPIVKIS